MHSGGTSRDVRPNISGTANAQSDIGFSTSSSYFTGSFIAGKHRENKLHTIAGYGSYDLSLDGSLSSKVYGGSEVIQPNSAYSLMIIKE